MNLLVLFISSFAWGAMLWGGAMLAQRYGEADGAARQVIWRLAAILLIAPWIIAPIGIMLGMTGPAAAPEPVINSAELAALPAWTGGDVAAPVSTAPTFTLPQISWPILLAIVVAAGWAVRLVAARRAKAALGRILAGASPAGEGPARRAVQRWKLRLGLKSLPALNVVSANVSPFSYGVRRPVIVAPRELERRLQAEALDLVVGHECLHIARGDGWVRPLERVIADVLWFNPFAWMIRRELDFARELACDEAVLSHVSQPQAYARTLRDVASMTAGLSNQSPAAAMSLAGGSRMMMKRVKGAMGYANGRPAWSALVAAGGLALLGAPVAIAQAVLAAPPPPPRIGAPPAPPAPRASANSDESVHVSFKARVTEVIASVFDGAQTVTLVQAEPASDGSTCTAHISGLDRVTVVREQIIAADAPIGRNKPGANHNIAITCKGQQKASHGGKALAVSEPRAPVEAIAPVATPALPARASLSPLSPLPPVPMAPMPPASRLSPLPLAPMPSAPASLHGPLEAPEPPPPPAIAAHPAPMPLPEPKAAPVPQAPPPPQASPVTPRNPKPISWASRPVLDAGRITSPFGQRVDPMTNKPGAWHDGVDIAAPMGAAIHTPGAGAVTFAGLRPGYASVVEIAYPDGAVMRYAHLQDFSVRAGQAVQAGDVIGRVGTDENSTGPHLHFEILEGGVTQDAQKIGGLVLIAK